VDVKAAVLGGAGYVGGELIRLLLSHPVADLVQVTSDARAGQPVDAVHPNLRGLTSLTFSPHETAEEVDVVFDARPERARKAPTQRVAQTPLIVDLSAESRGDGHAPNGRFVTGLPEVYRQELCSASAISVPGCIATAAILALYPLTAEGLVESHVIVDARTGSSGSGAVPSQASHHAERSGAFRVYRPAGHPHQSEIARVCGVQARMTVTAVEAVRGVQVVVHAFPAVSLDARDLWVLYRDYYAAEPFVRLVTYRSGIYRYPEPKVLVGSNFCDVGFALDEDGGRVVLIAALDNLVKGSAGNAIQSVNLAVGAPEGTALEFPGLHPV
jgi:N-acetyl-gamma-glutamyl-phosphate/LysW-gamma-L-alpha-aminoadipyl-6-phosphate reductase